ncbi:AglZ/HisF2 family acetamidino modification protein [Ramlibacter sp. AN1015]|uniref:AglZ/HisF2 family acetamidino modification protein n=1 Tax=Ramlibacter sp. AN1015 TaxID=3133428 RepID=UPI0030C5B135
MLRPRITPCLLVHEGGLVKTVAFKNPKYVGDPINAVRIFNEKEADELIVLDIDATARGREPDYKLIADLAAECRMPLCYGGGVRTAEQAKRIIGLGVEKVSLSAAAIEDPGTVTRIADAVGRQSVAVVIDVRKRGFLGQALEVCTHNATRAHRGDPIELAQRMQQAGAGEIIFNSVDRDGQMKGYDLATARKLREAVQVPITILGGAGSLDDLVALVRECGVVGAAAGSLFVFKGQYRAVLINYPNPARKDELLRAAVPALAEKRIA